MPKNAPLAPFLISRDGARDPSSKSSILAHLGRFGGHYWLGFLSRFGHHFVGLRNAHDFFDGRFALGDTPPAILPQGFHALGDGTLLELAAIAFSHDQLSQGFSYEANLINRRTSLVAGLPALIATGAALETSAQFFHRNTNLGQVFMRVIDQLHAIWA